MWLQLTGWSWKNTSDTRNSYYINPINIILWFLDIQYFLYMSRYLNNNQFYHFSSLFDLIVFIQDAKINVDADLVMLEELKVKCRTQTEQIMAWKKAYSMQVIEFYFHDENKWNGKIINSMTSKLGKIALFAFNN